MILLIDDSDHERALIRKMLESGGHEVSEAAGGDEGLTLFGTVNPSLVICDLMMPLRDGFATMANIQKLAPAAKIIAMSGVWYGKADHEAAAKDFGLVAVIEKPFERTQLLKLVANALAPKAKPKRSRTAAAKAKAAAKRKPKAKAKAKTKAKAKPKRIPKRAKRKR
ncbi:MAG TPA: response regulator [Alphaproteobacteria bacterium]